MLLFLVSILSVKVEIVDKKKETHQKSLFLRSG